MANELNKVNSSGIEDGSIVNADIKSDAAIALSKLASTPAVLTGSTNNTITTVTGANAIQGEANLTFDGSQLGIGSSANYGTIGTAAAFQVQGTNTGSNTSINIVNAATSNASSTCDVNAWQDYRLSTRIISGRENASNWTSSASAAASYLAFYTNSAGTVAERMRVKSDGNVEITDGDLVIGTSGHAIDFSAAATGTATSGEQKLDAYEQGTWTITYPNGTITAAHSIGKYIKVGNLCTAWMGFEIGSASSDTHPAFSLPFAQKLTGTNSDARATGSIMMHKVDWQSDQKQATPYIGAEASAVSIFMLRDNSGWEQLENSAIAANDWFYITITYQTA